jgi:lipopolysaccharide export system permease protein
MKVLCRYLIRHNLFLLFTILVAGISLYLLADLFERLNAFLRVGLGFSKLITYFLVKIPFIISQILPAVFFLSIVLQLIFLKRSREVTALNTGGISSLVLLRFFLVYSFIWAGGQLIFSQILGVMGEQRASRIWKEDVRGRLKEHYELKGLWFTEKDIVVHIGVCYPAENRGEDIKIYLLDKTGAGIAKIIKSKSFSIKDGRWLLMDGETVIPTEYAQIPFSSLEFFIQQDLRAFQVAGGGVERATQLSLGDLSLAIKRLKRSGSNVEALRTIWHGKLAYAASIIILGSLAFMITQRTENIYKAVTSALCIIFFYFSLNTLGMSLGQKGMLPPPLGAWFANMIFCGISLAGLFHAIDGMAYVSRKRFLKLR